MSEDRPGRVRGRQPHTSLPNWLCGNSTAIEKAVLFALQYRGNQIFPSHQTIADDAGCSRRTVIECIKAMRLKGWLTWEERRGKTGKITNEYTLLIWEPNVQQMHIQMCRSCTDHVQELHTPCAGAAHEQDLLNKTQLTKGGDAPASPDAPTPRDKRRSRAQEIQEWVESIPSEFSEYQEEIQSWLEARWDLSSKPNYRDNPWGPRKNSLKALKLLAEHCPDKTRAWIEDAAQGGYTSLGYSGFREKIQRLASIGSGQPPQRRRQHLPDLEAQFANDPL